MADWREQHPDLEQRMEEAREVVREKALSAIRDAGEKDWRAHAEWLRLCFPADYRRDASVNVSATATAQRSEITCDEETRQKLIDLRERIMAGKVEPLPS